MRRSYLTTRLLGVQFASIDAELGCVLRARRVHLPAPGHACVRAIGRHHRIDK